MLVFQRLAYHVMAMQQHVFSVDRAAELFNFMSTYLSDGEFNVGFDVEARTQPHKSMYLIVTHKYTDSAGNEFEDTHQYRVRPSMTKGVEITTRYRNGPQSNQWDRVRYELKKRLMATANLAEIIT